MSQDFTTRLQLEVRAAAERQERRGALGRLRVELPRPSRLAIVALAAAVLIAIVLAGGIRWSAQETVTAPRVAETFTLADGLGSIDTGFGAVWVADPSKPELLRVDPESHRVTARTPVMENPVVDAGAGAVWVAGFVDSAGSPSTLLKIDPATGAVAARTRLRTPDGERFDSAWVQAEREAVWVLGRQGALKVAPGTARVVDFIPLAERAGDPLPLDIWMTPDGLVAMRREGRLERYDLKTGKLDGVLPVRLAGARFFLPTDDGPVMGTVDGRYALADRETGQIVWDRRLGGTNGGAYAAFGSLWTHVGEPDGLWLYALSPRTGAIRSRTRIPEFGASSMTAVGDDLWIVTQTGKVMVVQTPPRKAG